ncbi:MAG: hypothetical protein WAQ75_12290 [Propionicimonas sp.]
MIKAILSACLAWGLDNNLTRKVALTDATWLAAVKGSSLARRTSTIRSDGDSRASTVNRCGGLSLAAFCQPPPLA